jgi:hypothetical protein
MLDSLFEESEANLLWISRDYLLSEPEHLPKIALRINYTRFQQIFLLHQLVSLWPTVSVEVSLKVYIYW